MSVIRIVVDNVNVGKSKEAIQEFIYKRELINPR